MSTRHTACGLSSWAVGPDDRIGDAVGRISGDFLRVSQAFDKVAKAFHGAAQALPEYHQWASAVLPIHAGGNSHQRRKALRALQGTR